LGVLDAPTWWIVLHGYGQLAADLASAARPLASPTRCVVAPEGLSRFYIDDLDTHERVGASWMTQEAREDEIHDYVRYLDAAVEHLSPPGSPPSIHVLGFSQGAATASRWAVHGDTPVDRLVLWGGAPAHDLDLSAHAEALRSMALTLVIGTEDPHVTADRRRAVQARLNRHDIPVTVHTFDGGHRLDRDVLHTLAGSSV
ncbi:MAG: dienelactone hydrolase family protein, partial [Salinibacter sp.]